MPLPPQAWRALGQSSQAAKASNWQLCLHLWQLFPTTKAATTALTASGRARYWRRSLAIYQSLTGSKAFASDPVPLNALCAALAHAAQWSRALHLLGTSCDPWRNNAVLTACGRASHWMLTLHLFSDMKLRRLADATSLNAAVHACQQAAHWQGALHLCSHTPWSIPSASATLSACAAVAAWHQALALFEDMLCGSSGFPRPGPVGASAVLTALGRSTRWAQALGIFEAFAATTAPSISCFGAVAAACEVGEAWQPALSLLSQLPPLLPDVPLLNAILGACGSLETDRHMAGGKYTIWHAVYEPILAGEEEGEREGQARRVLGLEDFHGHDGPSLQLGNVFTCLALRVISPFSLPVVMLLLKMKWMRPVLDDGTDTVAQAMRVLSLYSATPDDQFFLFCSLLLYFCNDSYRSTGPLVAVLFPWAIFLAIIPSKMAAQASATDRPSEVQCSKFVQFLMIIARQGGIPDETIKHMDCDGKEESCDRAMRLLSQKDWSVRYYHWDWSVRCYSWFADQLPIQVKVQKLGIADILRLAGSRGSAATVNRMRIFSEDGKLVGDSSWMAKWPDTDRFVAQQKRINNLAHITLHVPPHPTEKTPANLDLLECYKARLLAGEMKAADFTNQVSVDFPIPAPFWVTAMHSLASVLWACALAASVCLSSLMPQWHSRGTLQHWFMFLLFAWYGQVAASGLFSGRMLQQDIPELKRRLRELKVLNSMLAGQAAAAQRCLPVVRLQVPQDLLVWAEVRELLLARYSARQLEMETSTLVTTLLTLGMAACSLYYALQEDWDPGLLSVLALQQMLLYIIASLPFFVMGVLVNMEGSKSLDLMSQHALQAQLALCQPGVASAEEREHIQETVTMAGLLVQRLRDDSSAEVHILGLKLTPSTASAIASAVASALAFTLRSLPMREIEDKLHESDAWENITSILANVTRTA
ncbi:unnamed protein product [Symbiodinium sp. CCMP2592]|nr:unnamed protein product [Symbiodinium sp. CCMP2592]